MKQKYYYIGLILVIIIVLVMPSKTTGQSIKDTSIIKMNGTYNTSYGKVKDVYLDKDRSMLFYWRTKTKKHYFRKVKL